MNIVEIYHLPSPLLATLGEDEQIHQNFDGEADDRARGEVEATTNGVMKENQAGVGREIKHGDTRDVVGTSGTKPKHPSDVKAEDKPHVATTCSCTGPPVN